MKRALLALLLLPFLASCSNSLNMAVPHTLGAFLSAPEGREFQPIQPLDPRDAIVYVYRPISEWGYDEVQAPSFFMDGKQLFGLKSGAYSWIELPAGTYDFYAQRPLSILFLKTIFEMDLKVEGGNVYFFRYSELHPLTLEQVSSHPEKLQVAGPLQQVPENVGQREIKHLKLDEQGSYIGGQPKPRWAPFYTYPTEKQPAD